MTKENATDFLPLVQALAEGKLQILYANVWHDVESCHVVNFDLPDKAPVKEAIAQAESFLIDQAVERQRIAIEAWRIAKWRRENLSGGTAVSTSDSQVSVGPIDKGEACAAAQSSFCPSCCNDPCVSLPCCD